MQDAKYYALKKIFSLNDEIHLMSDGDQSVATIKGSFSPLRSKHEFLLADGRVYHFQCEKIWKGVYSCEGNGEVFRLYQHKGLSYSIFRNDEQIAAFTHKRITIGKGQRYDARINSDADVIVVTCMILTLNTADGEDDDDATVTINFGNIGPEERPFDASWSPK